MLRDSSLKDIPRLLPVLEQIMHESSRYNDMTPDYQYVGEQLEFLITVPNGIVIQDDQFRGVMLGVVSQPWYSPRLEGAEFILAIAKEHRGGFLAARFINEFVRQCQARGAVKVHAGSTLGINDELVRNLYRRLGFVPFGAGLVKEL